MNQEANREAQRKFKEKMYEAGFKRIYLWVKTKSAIKISNRESFKIKLEKLISGFNTDEQSKLFTLIIKILEGKKEVLKLKGKEKSEPEVNGGEKGRG